MDRRIKGLILFLITLVVISSIGLYRTSIIEKKVIVDRKETSIPINPSERKVITTHTEVDSIEKILTAEPLNQKCISNENQQTPNNELDKQADQFNEYLMQAATTEAQQMYSVIGIVGRDDDPLLKDLDQQAKDNLRINNLHRFLEDNPTNKLVSYHLMGICSTNPEHKHCSKTNISKALSLDGENGALWANVASIFLTRGLLDDATKSIEEAASAPVFDEYRTKRISLFLDTIVQSGIPIENSLIMAIGYDAATAYYAMGKITDFCAKLDMENLDRVDACLHYGERTALDGNTYINVAIGIAIQQSIYKNLKDDIAISRMNRKRELLNKQMKDAQTLDESLLNNYEFISYFIQTILKYNEIETFKLMKAEEIRLTSDPSYIACT